MPDDVLRGYRGREAIGIMDALAAAEQEREGDRFGDVAGVGGSELFVLVGHPQKVAQAQERSKNICNKFTVISR
jgi:hypothetical protein